MIRLSIGKHPVSRSSVVAAAGLLMALSSVAGMPGSGRSGMSAEAHVLAGLDDEWSAAAATRDAKRVASFHADDATAYPPNESAAVGILAGEKVWAACLADPACTLSWKTAHAEVIGAIGYTAGT